MDSGVCSVLGMNWRIKPLKQLMAIVLVAVLGWGLVSCSQPTGTSLPSKPTRGRLAEVSPPEAIQALKPLLDSHQPQVKILSPRPNQVLDDTEVELRFKVSDLPLFKRQPERESFSTDRLPEPIQATSELDAADAGPNAALDSAPSEPVDLTLRSYLQIWLDNQPYTQLEDFSSPLRLTQLTPGTHTVRAVAVRPWHESFKNEEAFAQTTFHVLTPTSDNQTQSDRPLLTYNSPLGTYGAEPVLLDFYLTNAPLHLVARQDDSDDIPDWQIRCTINGESFSFDRWEPIYLKGMKPGKNWVKLELLDEQGDLIANAFNSTVQLFTYEPNGSDSLARLTRGELTPTAARQLIDPTYVPPAPPQPLEVAAPEPEAEPESEPESEPASTAVPVVPEPELDRQPEPELEPALVPESQPEPDSALDSQELTAPKLETTSLPDQPTAIDSEPPIDPASPPDLTQEPAPATMPPEILAPTSLPEGDSAQPDLPSGALVEPAQPVEPIDLLPAENHPELQLQPIQLAPDAELPMPKPVIPPVLQTSPPLQLTESPTRSTPEETTETLTSLEQSLDNLEKTLEQIFQAPAIADPAAVNPPIESVESTVTEPALLPLFPEVAPDSSRTSPYALPSPNETPDLFDVFDRVKDFFESLRK